MDALNSVARALRGSTVGREMEKRTREGMSLDFKFTCMMYLVAAYALTA